MKIVASSKGIRAIRLGVSPKIKPVSAQTAAAAKQIRDYLSGQRKNLKFRIDLRGAGTPFQRRVWQALQKIPYGETRSYAWVAAAIGKPKAARAVGRACGANPVPLIIPCHRVVAANGGLGGFSGGLAWKRRLLALEGLREVSGSS